MVCLLFGDSAVETLMVRELVLFLREFAIGTVVDKVEVCVFLFCLACWLGLFLRGRPRVFPVRLRSFAVAILGGPFVGLGDVVESRFIDVRDNACVSVQVDDEASLSICLFLFHRVATCVVDFLVRRKCLNHVGEEACDP